MEEKKGKMISLTLIIVAILIFSLVAICQVLKIANETKTKKMKGLLAPKVETRKTPILESETNLPRIEDVQKGQVVEEEQQEVLEESDLKDLPVEKVKSLEKATLEEKGQKKELSEKKEESTLKTQPNAQELEELERRRVIIY